METQIICDKIKLIYNYNITKTMNSEEINCFMSTDGIYNKVQLHIKIIPFGRFPLDYKNINILPFVIETSIIDNLNIRCIYILLPLLLCLVPYGGTHEDRRTTL